MDYIAYIKKSVIEVKNEKFYKFPKKIPKSMAFIFGLLSLSSYIRRFKSGVEKLNRRNLLADIREFLSEEQFNFPV